MRSTRVAFASVLAVVTLVLGTGRSQQLAEPILAAPKHPPTAALRVLVPAYFYPVVGSPWGRLVAQAAAHPGRVAAIGDPANGPGAVLDPNYVTVFSAFRAAGGYLFGYVDSAYGTRPIAQVRADIDTWYAWYHVDAIFLDQMDNTPGAHEAYYQAIAQYVRRRHFTAIVLANPGVSAPSTYLEWNGAPVLSALCTYENGTGFSSWTADAWTGAFDRRSFSVLPYKLTAAEWQPAVDHAFAQNVGWFYATNDDLPNPWDTLPPWFESMVAYIDATY